MVEASSKRDFPYFDIYTSLVAFDGNSIFISTITGDLFLQFFNKKHYSLGWIPAVN